MTYSVVQDILYHNGKAVNRYKTSKTSGKMKRNPKFVVIHYTAGSSFDADVRILSSASAQVSCHLVLSPEGEWAQVGDFKDILWHAGKSSWKNYKSLNSYSVGVEVTCPGWVKFSHKTDGISYYTHSVGGAARWNDKDDTIVQARHKNGGPVYFWVQFSAAQMIALRGAVPAIMAHYDMDECIGHDMIAPTRKIDPGPCLPDGFYDFVNGTKTTVATITKPTASTNDSYKVANTRGTGLNMRKWPSSESAIIKSMPESTEVKYIRSKEEWYLVNDGITEGWVSSRYLTKI